MASWLRRTNAKERSAALSASNVLEGAGVSEQVRGAFAGGERGFCEFADAGGCEGCLDFGVGAEGQGAFLQEQVGGHVGFG
jgi:hypothetical protein